MPETTPPKSQIYTRTGDTGTTALFGGGRVPKDHPRVEAYGVVDELNSAIGVAIAFMTHPGLVSELASIQNELFNIGAELASESGVQKAADYARLFTNPDAKIGALEILMDELDATLPPLTTFVLPSGSQAGALLHLCRTVCRRAERAVVTLSHGEPVNSDLGRYLNRLSDLLFVMARYVNQADGQPETPWRKSDNE
jgi:cob(I)alamin adenosyltransferase